MTEVKKENGVPHIYLKETLTARHEEEKKRKGRPKEEIPDRNAVSPKTMEDLTSRDFLREWDAFSKVLQACGSYRKAEKWLREYCPAIPISRKEMAKILKSHAKMKAVARKKVEDLLGKVRKNPYLTDVELELAIETAIKEFTRDKIRQGSPKYPVGTKATDKRRLNLREWKRKKEAQKEEK